MVKLSLSVKIMKTLEVIKSERLQAIFHQRIRSNRSKKVLITTFHQNIKQDKSAHQTIRSERLETTVHQIIEEEKSVGTAHQATRKEKLVVIVQNIRLDRQEVTAQPITRRDKMESKATFHQIMRSITVVITQTITQPPAMSLLTNITQQKNIVNTTTMR